MGFVLADAALAGHFGGEAPCLLVFRGTAAELRVPAAELPPLRESKGVDSSEPWPWP